MVKKLLRLLGIIILLIAAFVVWVEQSRSFYCLSEDICITVWKRSSGCYIIPYKYYGVFKPTNNYIKTSNTGYVDIILSGNNSLLVDLEENAEIVQPISGKNLIERYSKNQAVNDSLYTIFDGTYTMYKKDVSFISINIKENYARLKKDHR
ncbi:hypothetical protein [Larkinella arboricola]|uniref:hypothetical protein n=1 Tax=Larkinella arboricola TaxID=643671 RepID=UPI000DB94B80|nr:hypothetical protein [Larkinella arboricola]